MERLHNTEADHRQVVLGVQPGPALVKGTLSRDFRPPFFHDSIPHVHLIQMFCVMFKQFFFQLLFKIFRILTHLDLRFIG